MALHAPVYLAMPVAGPSGARARAPVGPSPPHRKRVRQLADTGTGRETAITISSDSEDNFEDALKFYDGLEIIPPRRSGAVARTYGGGGDDDDDDGNDLQVVGLDRVAGAAPKGPHEAEQLGLHAGPVPAAVATSSFEDAFAVIVGILPDISRSHLKAQLLRQPAYGPADIEAVLEAFLSAPGSYPKEDLDVQTRGTAEGKGKGRAVEPEQEYEVEGSLLQVGNTIDEDEEVERTALAWLDTAKRAGKGTMMYREAA